MKFEVVGAEGRGSQVFDTTEEALRYLRWLHVMGEDAIVYEVEIVDGRVKRIPKA